MNRRDVLKGSVAFLGSSLFSTSTAASGKQLRPSSPLGPSQEGQRSVEIFHTGEWHPYSWFELKTDDIFRLREPDGTLVGEESKHEVCLALGPAVYNYPDGDTTVGIGKSPQYTSLEYIDGREMEVERGGYPLSVNCFPLKRIDRETQGFPRPDGKHTKFRVFEHGKQVGLLESVEFRGDEVWCKPCSIFEEWPGAVREPPFNSPRHKGSGIQDDGWRYWIEELEDGLTRKNLTWRYRRGDHPWRKLHKPSIVVISSTPIASYTESVYVPGQSHILEPSVGEPT